MGCDMSEETNAKMLQAYRSAVEAGQDVIADMLEDVILEKMDESVKYPITIGATRTTTDPPWKITCGTDVMPLDARLRCTGIDHLSKETTV